MDETTNPETEVAPEVETATELDDYGNLPDEVEPDEADEDSSDDLDEVEIDGKTYKVPKDAALRQADYTRKTQELAEQRRVLEASLTAVNQASQAERQIEVEFSSIQQAIATYNDIDWRAWIAQDPIAAQQARVDLDELHQQANVKRQQHQQAMNQRLSVAQQETAKRLEHGHRELATKIPGWGTDKANAILDFGSKTYGFAMSELQAITDPRMILALNDALEANKSRKATATRQKVEAQQAVKPAAKVSGGTAAVKPLSDRAGTDAWMKARMSQVAKR